MSMKSALTALLFGLGCCAAMADGQPPLTSVETLDVGRYLGTWYEIAKYPNWFQRHCVANTTAEYGKAADNQLSVTNRCVEEDGTVLEKTAVARQLGGAGSARLEVSFAPAWLSLVPAVWGDYWVIDIDRNYTLAAVSEPSRRYLWILSRTRKVDPQSYQQLLTRLRAQGFDTTKLETTQQD